MGLSASERTVMQRNNVLMLAHEGGFKFSKPDGFFLYTSGQIGPYFVQSIDITRFGESYRRAIKDLSILVRETLGLSFVESDFVISGGESRDWDFSNPVAYELGMPHAKLYKNAANNPALGADMSGKRVIHVADLQNEGSSIRDSWKPQIESAGGELIHAFFYVDRLEDGVNVMRQIGVLSDAVVPLNRLAWQALIDRGVVSKEQYDSLCSRSEDKDVWAHRMLRDHADVLIGYLQNPKDTAKAEKVLVKGYPDLRGELEERMKSLGYVHNWGEQK